MTVEECRLLGCYAVWRLETLRTKRTKLLCALPFLLRCRDHSTVPRFLQFLHHVNSDAADRIYRCTSFLVFFSSVRRLLVTANARSSQIPVTLTMEALRSSETSVEPHGVTSKKTPFFKATAVKTSNLAWTTVVSQSNINLLVCVTDVTSFLWDMNWNSSLEGIQPLKVQCICLTFSEKHVTN
jgi:hypothetical protein